METDTTSLTSKRPRDSPVSDSPSTPPPVHVTRKPRLGDTFSDPMRVQLHGNDFEWADLYTELQGTAEGSLHSAFVEACQNELDRLIAGKPEDPPSTVPSTPPTAAAANTSPPSNEWEKHYQNNQRHFPIKNYIIHAFPALIPQGTTLAELCAAWPRGEEGRRNESVEHMEEDSSKDGAQEEEAMKAVSKVATSSTTSTALPSRLLIEAGCGTGSVAHPLMKLFPRDAFICFDVSQTAVDLLASHDFAKGHVRSNQLATFAHDLTLLDDSLTIKIKHAASQLSSHQMSSSSLLNVADSDASSCSIIEKPLPIQADVITLVFVLCAMPSLAHMRHVLQQLRSCLHPERGVLCFRDYGALDHNFFRFHRQQNALKESLVFAKGDGTTQFFFEKEVTLKLFESAGLVPPCDVVYHCNRLVNRKNGKRMDKVFLNGTFVCKQATDKK